MELGAMLRKDEILDIDEAYNVVLILLIDGKTGIHGASEYGQHFLVGAVDVRGYHVDSGDHDVLGPGVGEVEHIVDHFLFFGLDDAVFMTHIHIGAQFGLGHSGDLLAGIDAHHAQDTIGGFVHHEDNGGEKLYQTVNNSAVSKGYLLRGGHGPCLGNDFTEKQDHDGQYTRGDAYRHADTHGKSCGQR